MQFRIGEDHFTIYKRPKQEVIAVKIAGDVITYNRNIKEQTITKSDPNVRHKYEAEFEKLIRKFFLPDKPARRDRRSS